MRHERGVVVLRGAVAASLATFIALLSHVAAGASMPGALGIAVPWVLSLAVCTMLAGRRLSLARLSIAVAVSQALFHVLFVLGTVTLAGTSSPHGHGSPALLRFAAPDAPAAAGGDLVMTGAHLVAAAITVAVLHRGEQLAYQLLHLARRLRRWVRGHVTVVLGAPVPRRVCATAPATSRRLRTASHRVTPVGRRGPPPVVTH